MKTYVIMETRSKKAAEEKNKENLKKACEQKERGIITVKTKTQTLLKDINKPDYK